MEDVVREHLNVAVANKPGSHLAFAWGVGNQLALFNASTPSSSTPSTTTSSSSTKSTPLGVYTLDVFPGWADPLLAESHGVFVALQHAAAREDPPLSRAELVASSRHYRAVLHAQIMSLEALASGTDVSHPLGEEELDEVRDQSLMYCSAELIWHLVEIFFVDASSESLLGPHLLDWLQLHSPVEGVMEVASSPVSLDHPDFWSTLYKLLLQGRLGTAGELLGSLSGVQDMVLMGLLALAGDAVAGLPLLAPGSPLSAHLPAWKQWRDSVSHAVAQERGDLEKYPQVQTLFSILLGVPSVLTEHASSWYEYLVAEILFVDPSLRRGDAGARVQRAIAAVEGPDPVLRNVDLILVAVMESDIHTALRYCTALIGSAWFVAHLTDLLTHAGVVETFELDFGTSLREYYLLEYGIKLMSSRQHWQLAATYFGHATTLGSAHMTTLLEACPPDSAPKTAKLINTATYHGLDDVAATIRNVRARSFLSSHSLLPALVWYLRARNTPVVSAVADKIIDVAIATNALPSLYLVDNLGSDLVVSERLAFLAKYRQFQLLRNAGADADAAAVLVKLLSSHMVPRRLVRLLLADAVPLLEGDQLVFSSRDTYALMAVLADAAADHRAGDVDSMDNQIISLALSRNLARALLETPIPRKAATTNNPAAAAAAAVNPALPSSSLSTSSVLMAAPGVGGGSHKRLRSGAPAPKTSANASHVFNITIGSDRFRNTVS